MLCLGESVAIIKASCRKLRFLKDQLKLIFNWMLSPHLVHTCFQQVNRNIQKKIKLNQ